MQLLLYNKEFHCLTSLLSSDFPVPVCVLDVPAAAENLIVASLRSVPVDIALLHVTVLSTG